MYFRPTNDALAEMYKYREFYNAKLFVTYLP